MLRRPLSARLQTPRPMGTMAACHRPPRTKSSLPTLLARAAANRRRCNRVTVLREHGFKARALAVLALPTDTAEELGEVTKGQPGGC